jgi:hypothetical protein
MAYYIQPRSLHNKHLSEIKPGLPKIRKMTTTVHRAPFIIILFIANPYDSAGHVLEFYTYNNYDTEKINCMQ